MDEIRFNPPPIPEQPEPLAQKVVEEVKNKKKIFSKFFGLFNFKKILKVLAIIAISVAVIFLVFLGRDVLGGIFKPKTNEIYSAVFLSNGQVYFGKVAKINELEIVLNNVFYIQIKENTTPEKAASTLNQTSFNLVKLGNELHGPTDELFINRSQVVFYEKLRDDSKVVESIRNYK